MLPALLVVLALAGAPADTNVTCNPAISSGELGVTYPAYVTVVDGQTINGPLTIVQLGPQACAALAYASSSKAKRAAMRRRSPYIHFAQRLGVGLQIALHEAEHVALDSSDECLVEKTTRAKISGLLVRLDPAEARVAERAATASDAALPPAYHGC